MSNYLRQVHVYETDLMGIVHHSNYLRYFEEARVTWCKHNNLFETDPIKRDLSVFGLTVYETRVRHVRPARYGDELEVSVQVKVEGARVIYQYKMKINKQIICLAETVHCHIDTQFKVKRIDPVIVQAVGKCVWTETWL